MKKLLLICTLLLSLQSFSQWLRPNFSYGNIQNRLEVDSAFLYFTGCGNPHINTTDSARKHSALFFDSCNHRFWVYDPHTKAWDTLSHTGGGGSGGTFGLSDNFATSHRTFDQSGFRFRFANPFRFTIGDTIPDPEAHIFVLNNSSQRNFHIGPQFYDNSTFTTDDSAWYNTITVVDTNQTSFATGEYHRPPRAALYLDREQFLGNTGLSIEDGWSLFTNRSTHLDVDSAHVAPSSSGFAGATKNNWIIQNTSGVHQLRKISSGSFFQDCAAVQVNQLQIGTASGSSTHLYGYWAGNTSRIYGTASRDTIDNYNGYLTANQGGGTMPYVKKFTAYYANPVSVTNSDSIWFLQEGASTKPTFSYIDGNLSVGGGLTGDSHRLHISGTALVTDTTTITTMGNTDSSNRAASTAYVKRVALLNIPSLQAVSNIGATTTNVITVQNDNGIIVSHAGVNQSLLTTATDGTHFGGAIDLKDLLSSNLVVIRTAPLTTQRTWLIPDETDTAASRTFARNLVTSAIAGANITSHFGVINSLSKSLNGGVKSADSLVLQTADHTYPGLMSANDKARLDSNKYVKPDKTYDSLGFKRNDSTFVVKSISANLDGNAIEKVITDSTLWVNSPADYVVGDLQTLGSSIKAAPIGWTPSSMLSSKTLTSTRLNLIAVAVHKTITVTGVQWDQVTQGVGTFGGTNYNGFALYSKSGTTLTLIDSTLRDSTVFKTASNTWGSKAFPATHVLTPGVYYVACIWSATATTTSPVLASTSAVGAEVWKMDFPTNVFLAGYKSATTPPPGSITMSTVSLDVSNHMQLFLY